MSRVVVCMGCCCPQLGGIELLAELKQKLKDKKEITLQYSGCIGPCSKGPNAIVNDKLLYRADAEEVLAELSKAENTTEN